MSEKLNTNPSEQVEDSRIDDVELAWDMAKAEDPHIVEAQEAMKKGNFSEVAGHLAVAEQASIDGASKHFDEQQAELDRQREKITGVTKQGEGQAKQEQESSFETKVANTAKALAEHYNVPEEDFNLVSYETEDGETKHTVMYTGLQGIDLGDPKKVYDPKRSYNSLMADDSHIIEIDGNQADDRSLTEDDYRAFISQEITKDTDPLPDSGELDIWTGTLLPGEVADDVDARYGEVGEGQPDVFWIDRDDGNQSVRFRPAVEIAEG